MKINLLSVALAAGLFVSGVARAQTTLYGITNANAIFTMSNVSTPSVISGPYAISGIASSQVLVGLDSRPSTGGLYALGYDSVAHIGELYKITNTGTSYAAIAVSGVLASMDLGTTNNAAFDFVSTTDNDIRVIGRNGNKYVMSAVSGSVTTTTTGGLSFTVGDLHTGIGVLAATAYTNSVYGADATQEVGYDVANNVLVKMDAGSFLNGFNNISTTIHSIGVTTGTIFTSGGSIGMDTWYDTITNKNTIYMTGSTLLSGAHLYKYDLSSVSGIITDLGAVGGGSLNVRDVAFATLRDSTATVAGHLLTGLSLNLRKLVYFDSYHPGNILREVTLHGMASGQVITAIDYSSNGMLYGLGYNSISHNYQLYTIDSLTGNLLAVNTTPISLNLGTDDGSGNYINAGFRFIATSPNRIRVTGNNGSTNVQIDALTGAILATDAALQYITGDLSFGASANLTSVAYTGFAGDSVTQMFGFDANTGSMVKFNATNSLAGYGNGASGFINTDISLNSVLSLLLHTSVYNNSYINITYDPATSSNIGFVASNYLGDSSTQLNYSILYDMTGMLVGYHKGTAGSPTQTGRIGYATPVKDIAVRRASASSTGLFNITNSTSNDLLLYPNPVLYKTQIELPYAITGTVNIDVIGLTGNVVHISQNVTNANTVTLDMSNYPVGLYTVSVYAAGMGLHNLKVVKQ